MPLWIQVRDNTPMKPEVMQIAGKLGITRQECLGRLVEFWLWAAQNWKQKKATRALRSVTQASPVTLASLFDNAFGVTGFSVACRDVGWLSDVNGHSVLTNFEKYNGKEALRRASTAKRQLTYRRKLLRNARVTLDHSPDHSPASKNGASEKGNGAGTLLANLMANKKKSLNTNTHTATVFSEQFLQFWRHFPQPRRFDKSRCFRKWKEDSHDQRLAEILVHLTAMKQTDQWQRRGVIPSALVYINQRRWEAGLPAAPAVAARPFPL